MRRRAVINLLREFFKFRPKSFRGGGVQGVVCWCIWAKSSTTLFTKRKRKGVVEFLKPFFFYKMGGTFYNTMGCIKKLLAFFYYFFGQLFFCQTLHLVILAFFCARKQSILLFNFGRIGFAELVTKGQQGSHKHTRMGWNRRDFTRGETQMNRKKGNQLYTLRNQTSSYSSIFYKLFFFNILNSLLYLE